MDKFLTFEGEMPIWLNDFDFIDKSVRDTFTRLALSLTDNNQNAILSGCRITAAQGGVSWTSGVVLLRGEILPIEAGNSPLSTTQLFFNVSESFNAEGDRSFKNGTLHRCYSVRKAVINDVSGGLSVRGVRSLDSFLKAEDILNVNTDTTAVEMNVIRKKSGGLYIRAKLSAFPGTQLVSGSVSGLTSDETAPFIGKHTYASLYFKSSDGLEIIPIEISCDSGENSKLSISILASKSPSLRYGDGQFYCRLSDM